MLRAALLAGTLTVVVACTGHDAEGQAGGGALYQFGSATKVGQTISVAHRKSSYDFSGSGLAGGKIALSDYRGQVVVVNFWASWCPPCRVEMPGFDSVSRALNGKGVQFLGVDTKDYSRSDGQSFVEDNQISYPMIFDEPGKIAIQIGHLPVGSLPFTVLFDKKQRVAAVYVGLLQAADLRPVLVTLLSEH